jgi:hypothetical protein
LIILIILANGTSYEDAHMRLLQPLVTSSLFDPNILLNTLLSNTLSLCFSLNVTDQVSRPYRTTGKIIVLYEGKSINKLQMDIELKQIRVLILKI